MANDELYTPKFIFEALKIDFDLDVCAPESGPLHTPAHKWYSLKDDGLAQPWFGRVWMNPPYSKPSPWVDRWLDHKDGFALLPMGGNGNWLQKLWESQARCVLMKPNVPFINTQGEVKKISYRISIWAIGERNLTLLQMSGLGLIR